MSTETVNKSTTELSQQLWMNHTGAGEYNNPKLEQEEWEEFKSRLMSWQPDKNVVDAAARTYFAMIFFMLQGKYDA